MCCCLIDFSAWALLTALPPAAAASVSLSPLQLWLHVGKRCGCGHHSKNFVAVVVVVAVVVEVFVVSWSCFFCFLRCVCFLLSSSSLLLSTDLQNLHHILPQVCLLCVVHWPMKLFYLPLLVSSSSHVFFKRLIRVFFLHWLCSKVHHFHVLPVEPTSPSCYFDLS